MTATSTKKRSALSAAAAEPCSVASACAAHLMLGAAVRRTWNRLCPMTAGVARTQTAQCAAIMGGVWVDFACAG